MEYKDFLETKVKTHVSSGFDIDEKKLNSNMFDFQKFIVKRALKAGKYAIFADCGLGKTLMQLEWANQVSKKTKKPVLILAPLAVGGQTIKEGEKFGIKVNRYDKISPIQISNYEQLNNIDCSIFSGIVLDESSILKNFSGAYRNLIITNFEKTNYKLACTATPSPNDELEIGNHAEFLNVMSSQDMRAVFFTTDKEIIKGNKYRLKGHAENDFYSWVASWAIMISSPADLGFLAEGYTLPKLNIIETQVKAPVKDNGQLFNNVSVSATTFNEGLRDTKDLRIIEAANIVNNSTENFIIWVKHNDEGDMLKALIPEAIEVSGSDSDSFKEKHLLGFANNDFRVLISKTKIAGMGMNYQNCHNQIFASLDFSFESLYQGIRRVYRFGQTHEVNIHLITSDTMQNVSKSITEKQTKFEKLQQGMIKNMKQESKEIMPIVNLDPKIIKTENYTLINGDCVEEVSKLEAESIDFCFFSPPFGALYVFSNDPKDMSNVSGNEQFMEHFQYLIKELYRVIKSGRLCSLHIMQSTTLLGRDGYYSIKDFRGEIIRAFQSEGFYFHAENMIRKDPKTAAIRTKNRQLMHGTTKSDSSIVRPGLADYIITFRKPGENKVPIKNNIPFDLWCKIAEPIWIDIEEGDTIDFRGARDNKDERHITATQLQPIEWCYMMWCNVGETVLSPFSGVASEGYVAVKTGRKYIGIELKESYHNFGHNNLKAVTEQKKQISLI